MKQFLVRLLWAWKVLRAKSFVVLTESESTISLQGIKRPPSLNDEMMLAAQLGSLVEFKAGIDSVMKRLKTANDGFYAKGERL
jgi:hypothetical protein